MKCPQCASTQTAKNGHRRSRQCYKCKQCGRQFLESYRPWRYSEDVKQLCLKMYLNGMGLRGIERVTEIHHTTIMYWIRETGHQLKDAPESEEIPEVTDLDELQTFVGRKRNKLWIWMRRQSQTSWNSGMGNRRPQCRNLPALVAHRQMLALFLLCHRWLEGLSNVY